MCIRDRDTTRAALYLPGAFMDVMRGKGDNLQKAKNLMGLQRQKVRNILDYDTTHESFMSYLDARPEVMDKMMRYIAGGVDSEEVVKKLGFNPDEGILKYGEKFTNFFQTLYATKAQDVITKSIEFMYNIDKQMRMKYKKSYNELLESGELDTLMSKQDYIEIEARAVDDTMKAVFGKKFGKTNQAKNNHAISGAPLKVSIKITDTNFIVLYELARPRAKITPNGKPANIAIIVSRNATI